MGQFPHTEPQSGLHEGVGGVILSSLGQTGSPGPHMKRTTFLFSLIHSLLWKKQKKHFFSVFFGGHVFFVIKNSFFRKKQKCFFQIASLIMKAFLCYLRHPKSYYKLLFLNILRTFKDRFIAHFSKMLTFFWRSTLFFL